MKMILALIPVSALVLSGCDTRTSDNKSTTTTDSTGTTTTTTTTPPDNTARNERDRSGTQPVPTDQSESQADVTITAEVRRLVTADDTMSINARNIKIITQSGVVTLRGPVDSQAEKDAIEAKVKGVAGVTRVDNQLEVKSS